MYFFGLRVDDYCLLYGDIIVVNVVKIEFLFIIIIYSFFFVKKSRINSYLEGE